MRVAIIAPPWLPVPPPAYGGTEAVLDTLACGLQAAGHDVLLYTTGDSTCPVPTDWVLERAVGTEAATPATELRHVINAYDAALRWGADVIHDHTLTGPVYGRRFGVPLVTTNHGPFDGELRDLYRAIGGDVAVIAISHAHARGADGPVAAVIHHGVDVDLFPVGPGDGGYAAFLGRMNPDKGVHLAIEVARRAGVPLLIAAKMREPGEREYYENVVRPLLGGDVEYVGEVGGAEKLRFLGQAMCLLNPICWPEPFGMVMVESLACGTPVVAFANTGQFDIVDHKVNGYLAENLSSDDLAEGLAWCLERSGAGSELSLRAREKALRRFDIRKIAHRHLELYEQLLSTRRRDAANTDMPLSPEAETPRRVAGQSAP